VVATAAVAVAVAAEDTLAVEEADTVEVVDMAAVVATLGMCNFTDVVASPKALVCYLFFS